MTFRNWGQRAVELERKRRIEREQADVIATGRTTASAWLAEQAARPTREPRQWTERRCAWCNTPFRVPTTRVRAA